MGPQPARASTMTSTPLPTVLAMSATKIRSMRKWRRRNAPGTALNPARGRVSAITAMAPEALGEPRSRAVNEALATISRPRTEAEAKAKVTTVGAER